jgi:DNA repair protein SbcC/Rad50
MRILSIQLKNIKSHRDRELSFAPGINVLSGPNGVGKSTIFEAIGYAMFGVDAQKFVGNVERFISIGAKKGEISVTFQLDNSDHFRVTRTVGAATRWLLAKDCGGNFEVEEHKDARETEARLKELLGLDNGRPLAEQFELVIGPFQNEFLGPFVIKQATKRRDEFDAILGIDTWRKTFSETNALARTIKNKVEVLQADIKAREEQVVVLPEKREELKVAENEIELAQKSLAEMEEKLGALEIRLGELNNREQAINNLQKEISLLDGQISACEQNITVRKQQVSEAEQALEIIQHTRTGMEAFEKAEAHLVGLRKQEKLRRDMEQKVATLSNRATGLQGRIESEAGSIEEARAELANEAERLTKEKKALKLDESILSQARRLPEIREQLSCLRRERGQLEGRRSGLVEGSEKLEEGICPFFQEPCQNIAGQKPRDVFSAKQEDLDHDLTRLASEIDKLSQEEILADKAAVKIKEVKVQIGELERQQVALGQRRRKIEEREEGLKVIQSQRQDTITKLDLERKALEAFANLEKDIEKAEEEKTIHKEARDLYFANFRLAEDLAARQESLQKTLSRQELNRTSLAEKKSGLEKARKYYDAGEHGEERQRKEALIGQVGTLRQKVADLSKDKERLAKEIDKLKQVKKEIEAQKARVKTFGEKDKLVKFLRNRVFKEVSKHLSERFREEISLRADRIYRTISEADEELYWGENYQIVLRDMADGEIRERTDDQLSGGQIMSAVVALRLAMLQTIGARIAFFDEPTSNLDITRRENLAHAFRAIDVGREEVTEHWYDQLFLISHDVAFTEVTDQTIALE